MSSCINMFSRNRHIVGTLESVAPLSLILVHSVLSVKMLTK